MGWLRQISARLGLGSPSAPPTADLHVSFEDDGVSADAPVQTAVLQVGPLRPGDSIFGDYEINCLLGAGGFGEVYLAEMKPQGRAGMRYTVIGVPFALKRVRAANPAAIHALRHELRTWGELPQHPNLLRYRFFRVSGDELFIASEYVKGGSLADRLSAGPLPVAQIIDLGMQIVWGLAALHEAGFLHGDLKPSNVLLDDEGMVARLCDYGLSRRIPIDGDKMHHTLWDAPRGHTPAFSSPEQARGEEMDVAADVWSLGALLLAAAMPDANWSDWRGLGVEVQDWVKGLPPGLARVILTSLQEEASARVSLEKIAADLSEAWTQVADGDYDRARPAVLHAPRQELSQDWYAARTIALQSGDFLFDEIDAEESKDVQDEARLKHLNELMDVCPHDMTAISASAGRTAAAQDLKILEMLEGACAVYRGLIRLGSIDLTADLAHAARALSDFHKRRGDLQAAAKAMAQIAEADTTPVTTDAGLIANRYESLRQAAVCLDMEGRPHEAIAILDKATEELGAALRSVPPKVSAQEGLYRLQFLMLVDRGVALSIADEPDKALEAFELAFVFEANIPPNEVEEDLIGPKLRANALVQRANMLDCIGQSHNAIADYERAIGLLETAENSQAMTEDLESAKLNLGVTLTKLGDTDRSILLLEAVVAARASRLAPKAEDADHRFHWERPVGADWEPRHRLAFAHYTLADALNRAGQVERAEASAEQAHEIWKRLVEDEGHAQLGQYQFHAMMQIGMIGINNDE